MLHHNHISVLVQVFLLSLDLKPSSFFFHSFLCTCHWYSWIRRVQCSSLSTLTQQMILPYRFSSRRQLSRSAPFPSSSLACALAWPCNCHPVVNFPCLPFQVLSSALPRETCILVLKAFSIYSFEWNKSSRIFLRMGSKSETLNIWNHLYFISD